MRPVTKLLELLKTHREHALKEMELHFMEHMKHTYPRKVGNQDEAFGIYEVLHPELTKIIENKLKEKL